MTPNTETTYGTVMLDLKAWGPTVIESPPQSLCVVDDFWFRYVTDMGIAGPDRGEGGKYLFLPPGYDGDVPDGYFVFRTPTFTNFVVLRALGGVPAMKQTRIYPLSEAGESDAERVHQPCGAALQHHPLERLQLLRGGRRARPGGAGRGTGC